MSLFYNCQTYDRRPTVWLSGALERFGSAAPWQIKKEPHQSKKWKKRKNFVLYKRPLEPVLDERLWSLRENYSTKTCAG
jgi:hypothetical protein